MNEEMNILNMDKQLDIPLVIFGLFESKSVAFDFDLWETSASHGLYILDS